jgi:hypothetical protein
VIVMPASTDVGILLRRIPIFVVGIICAKVEVGGGDHSRFDGCCVWVALVSMKSDGTCLLILCGGS